MSIQYKTLEDEKTFSSLGIDPPTFTEGATTLLPTTTFIYTLCFIAIIGAAFYRLVVVGGLRLQPSEENIRKGNDIFKHVVYGLLGSFVLFLLLATLNSQMISGDITLSVLDSKKSVGSSTVPVGKGANATNTANNLLLNKGYADRLASHNAVVARLSPSGISTNRNNAPCTEAQFQEKTPSCTSLAFLDETAIQTILKINADCRCSVVISGGTEPGHKSHGEGKRAFDLRITDPKERDPLFMFIKSVGREAGSSGNCHQQYIYNSFTFCDEKRPGNAASTWAPHFHVH